MRSATPGLADALRTTDTTGFRFALTDSDPERVTERGAITERLSFAKSQSESKPVAQRIRVAERVAQRAARWMDGGRLRHR